MFKCLCCGSNTYWSSDWDPSDYGYDYEGIIGVYICSKCNTHVEVRDFLINENTEERSVKYYLPDYEEDELKNEEELEVYDMVSEDIRYCLYCNTKLETLKEDILDMYEDGVLTIKKCPHCEAIYEVEDVYPLSDIYRYPDDYLTVYDLRTVRIK